VVVGTEVVGMVTVEIEIFVVIEKF